MRNLMQSIGICAVLVSLLVHPAVGEGISEAAEAILTGAYPRAIAVLDPQVTSSPENLEVRGLLATALYLNGQRLRAEGQILILRRLDPEGRQTAYLVSRHFLPAFRLESPLVAPLVDLLAHSGADGFLWVGQTYQDRQLYTDAVTILSRGVSRYPNSARLLSGLAFNEWKAGFSEPAIMAYLGAVHLEPHSWGLYYNLGWVYYTGEMYAAAVTAWKAALDLVPSNPVLPKLIQDAERRMHG